MRSKQTANSSLLTGAEIQAYREKAQLLRELCSATWAGDCEPVEDCTFCDGAKALDDLCAALTQIVQERDMLLTEFVQPLLGDDEPTRESLQFWCRDYMHFDALARELPEKLAAAHAEVAELKDRAEQAEAALMRLQDDLKALTAKWLGRIDGAKRDGEHFMDRSWVARAAENAALRECADGLEAVLPSTAGVKDV